jgi:hypothetical protein
VSIVKRIKREARNNPAKAAVLVGLLGLALYSWAPLMWGWLSAGDQAPQVASERDANSDRASQPDTKPSAAEENAGEQATPSWNELRQWRIDSPWTKPTELADLRDPFGPLETESAIVAESEGDEESPVATPEQMVAGLDIELTGTIVSPKRRVALLDGRAYREGDLVLVDHLGTTWELEIRRIEANRVTLGWQTTERELIAPARQSVGRIELVGRSP